MRALKGLVGGGNEVECGLVLARAYGRWGFKRARAQGVRMGLIDRLNHVGY